MRLILGGINGQYLRTITEQAKNDTEEVIAAVAYATDDSLLFNWCWQNKIPLKFYGRLDETVAVKQEILNSFLKRKSPNFVCKLVQHHHAKVIWWKGFGIYIGSANLTGSAWYKNVEAGCFFNDDEIDAEMISDIERLFQVLEKNSTPLTEELLATMDSRAKIINKNKPDSKKFWDSPSLTTWNGLVHRSPKKAKERQKKEFLEEWHNTLQELRDIGERISQSANRPSWINAEASVGAQADQFLHAHYYQRTFDGRKANYQSFYENNKSNKEEALAEAIDWWKNLNSSPTEEAEMLNVTAPYLKKALSENSLTKMNLKSFEAICTRIHAISDYARRVRNKSVSLPDNQGKYTIPQKIEALSKRIWNSHSGNGSSVTEILAFILYSGSDQHLPERLWQAAFDYPWKIDGLGVSALGEIVGWARPDKFPPRNGRTSKALRSLGYDVKIHV